MQPRNSREKVNTAVSWSECCRSWYRWYEITSWSKMLSQGGKKNVDLNVFSLFKLAKLYW